MHYAASFIRNKPYLCNTIHIALIATASIFFLSSQLFFKIKIEPTTQAREKRIDEDDEFPWAFGCGWTEDEMEDEDGPTFPYRSVYLYQEEKKSASSLCLSQRWKLTCQLSSWTLLGFSCCLNFFMITTQSVHLYLLASTSLLERILYRI